MTTASLLQKSVQVAGKTISPQLGTLSDRIEEYRLVDADLLAEHERKILQIADASAENIPLINVATAIAAGGAGPHGFPRLALASYEMSMDRELVYVTVEIDGRVRFMDERWGWKGIRLPAKTLPRPGIFSVEGSAPVPPIPIVLRQREPDGVVLLFEVEDWRRERMPTDPYLLRHVAGNVYAVIGTWDITDNELKAQRAARNLGI